jgi:hypothetical protein
MFMMDDDIKKYSDLYWWLKLDLPKLPQQKPKVWAAFTRYAPGVLDPLAPWGVNRVTGLSYPWLLWGAPPKITVDSGRMMECVDDGEPVKQPDGSFIQNAHIPWYGFTGPGKTDLIIVASDLARGAGLPGDVGVVLEATILHEFIHFCRKKAGQDVDDEGPSYAFEEEAYGHRVARTWQTCMSRQYFVVK